MPLNPPVVAHLGQLHARTAVLAAIDIPSCVLLLGAAGTGKTMVLQALARDLRAADRPVHLVARGDLVADAPPAAPSGVMLVDEATLAGPAALTWLAGAPPCAVVLAGLPELAARCLARAETGVAAPTRVEIPPLPHSQARQFAIDWLSRSGRTPRLTMPAVERLLAYASGRPRLLVQLLQAALFLADSEPERITPRHIDEVASFRGAVLAGPALEGGVAAQTASPR